MIIYNVYIINYIFNFYQFSINKNFEKSFKTYLFPAMDIFALVFKYN